MISFLCEEGFDLWKRKILTVGLRGASVVSCAKLSQLVQLLEQFKATLRLFSYFPGQHWPQAAVPAAGELRS